MADSSKGFRFRYRLSGEPPTMRKFLFKDTETLTKGDIVNLEGSEVDLAATNDTALLGVAMETKSGTDSTTYIQVIVDADAVYEVYDPNARNMGANLDLAGTTGQMTVAASINADLVVVANSNAAQPTLVMITRAETPLKG